MSSDKQKYILAGLGAVVVTGFLYYLSKDKQEKPNEIEKVQENVKIEQLTVLNVLKDLKRELFSLFTNFAMISQQINMQSGGQLQPEQVKAIIMGEPMFKQVWNEFEKVEAGVYNKYNVSKQDIEDACQTIYKDDVDIQQIQQEMKESLEKSFMGIPPSSECQLPPFMTATKTVEIMRKILTKNLEALNDKLLEMMEAGEQIDMSNPNAKMMELMQDLKAEVGRDEVFKEYKLDNFEEPAQKILNYAIETYTKTNEDNFDQKMHILEDNHAALMQQLFTQGPMIGNQVRQIMQKETSISPPSMGGFGGMGMGFGGFGQ